MSDWLSAHVDTGAVNDNANANAWRAALVVLWAGLVAPPAWGNGNLLYLECPCSVVSDGTTLTVNAGVRSFRQTDSGELRFRVYARPDSQSRFEILATLPLSVSLAAERQLAAQDWSAAIDSSNLTGEASLRLRLDEWDGEYWTYQDELRMESPVALEGAFEVGDLDYLEDSDDDGVGDLNEGLAGTDPADSESTPGDSTVDFLALYTQGYADLFDGDAVSRINHLMVGANTMLRDSDVPIQFRAVGAALVDVENEDEWFSRVDRNVWLDEGDRHGADLISLFTIAPPNVPRGYGCQPASRQRGHLNLEGQKACYVNLKGHAGASTLIHELGHAMTLAHSVSQGEYGTWRWSRGHDVPDEFKTIMSYGRGGAWLEVFSSLGSTCSGVSGQDYPCGVAGARDDGADAVATLDAVRFQLARIRSALDDADEDGFVDPVDLFPDDSGEWWDADDDGTGDNADTDDDNDGVLDGDDVGDNADPDADGDGAVDELDAFPLDATKADLASYLFTGESPDDQAGEVLSPGGDGDAASFLIGVPQHDVGESENAGAVYLVAASDLSTMDSADGLADRAIGLGHVIDGANSWKFVGEAHHDEAGISVASVADTDDDGKPELLIGAWGHDPGERARAGATYFLASGDLSSADLADGTQDGVIGLGHTADQQASWKMIGESAEDRTGSPVAAPGDIDGDGHVEIALNSQLRTAEQRSPAGAVYLVSTLDLPDADTADGQTDRVVDLGQVASQSKSFKLHNGTTGDWATRPVTIAREGVGSTNWLAMANDLMSSTELPSADGADGEEDGVVDLDNLAGPPDSWKLDTDPVSLLGDTDGDGGDNFLATGYNADGTRLGYLFSLPLLADVDTLLESGGWISGKGLGFAPGIQRIFGALPLGQTGASSAGDVDGDGVADILFGDLESPAEDRRGTVYLLTGADLEALDRIDGSFDERLRLWNVAGDTDSDGVSNTFDRDDDGDDDPEFAVGADVFDYGAVYIVEGQDLLATDALDGLADGIVALDSLSRGSGSWILGASARTAFGTSVSAARQDDADTLLLGEPGSANRAAPGTVHRLVGARLLALDSADSRADGTIYLGSATGQQVFRGEAGWDGAGSSLAAGDFDGDGEADAIIGAPLQDAGGTNAGAVYLAGSRAITEGLNKLGTIASREHSWKFVGAAANGLMGTSVSLGDFDGDGQTDLVLGGYSELVVLSGTSTHLRQIDLDDGTLDGIVDLGRAGLQTGSRRLTAIGRIAPTVVGDVDGDGMADLLIGDSGGETGLAYLIPASSFFDGETVSLRTLATRPGVYTFHVLDRSFAEATTGAPGDVDGDGLDDLLLGLVPWYETDADSVGVYLVTAADLAHLDIDEGDPGGAIHLSNIVSSRP